MVYIETRVTAQQVLDDIAAELSRMAHGVINAVDTFRSHPTYNTKTAIRIQMQQLQGATSMASRITGGNIPADIAARVMLAQETVHKL